MDRKNNNQEGNQLMTNTIEKPEIIVLEPQGASDDKDTFDVACSAAAVTADVAVFVPQL